jgi:ABC-2 type transport system ATP-binding protein
MSAVVVDDLKHTYLLSGGASRPALKGIGFTVSAGEIFGVLGPNGGGKTTLFRILSTALRPTSGRATLWGVDVTTAPDAAREKMGVVFQSPSLDKKLSVMENLQHQGRLYGLSGDDLQKRAKDLLGHLGLLDRANDIVETLSGGLQRRAEIAKSLLHRPALLLLDEPTTGLDPGARRDVWTYLGVLKREGVTVLVTTHLMEEAERCERLIILDRGQIAAAGTPAGLREEIQGDVVVVTSPRPDDLAAALRQKFDWTSTVQDGVVRLERPRGHDLIPQIVGTFPELVTSASVGKPTLEDVFVRHTGHRFWGDALSEGKTSASVPHNKKTPGGLS